MLVVFIFINIPCWDIQCTSKECANITHSLTGLYLCVKYRQSWYSMSCYGVCKYYTLMNRTLLGGKCLKSQCSMSTYGVCKEVTRVVSHQSRKSHQSQESCQSSLVSLGVQVYLLSQNAVVVSKLS